MTSVIYTVTSVEPVTQKTRCWTWFSSLEEAQRIVENVGDYFRNRLYTYLVIEEIPEGNITQLYREWWYRWNGEGWVKAEKPAPDFEHFGMG